MSSAFSARFQDFPNVLVPEANRIDNADESLGFLGASSRLTASHLKPKALGFGALRLLESFLDTFHGEPLMVQMQLLTAIVKLFLQKPSSTQDMAARL